ncbi:MAG TPA: CRISPR-associated endonuclease Cas3'' [Gemmatimonadaceae bacterium]
MTALADVLTFWGKAQPHADAAAPYHPIVYHLLDVAAVADALLTTRPLARARAATLLGLASEQAHALLVTLAALHDLGKFAPGFQAKVPALWPAVLGSLDPEGVPGGVHTDDGYRLWYHELVPAFSDRLWRDGGETLEVLAPAIFGHHGRPTVTANLRDKPARWVFRSASAPLALACAEAVIELLLPGPVEGQTPPTRMARAASWWVAGLVTVADWIGSRQEWFAYQAPDAGAGALAAYWRRARARAREVVQGQGLASPKAAGRATFPELTGIADPSPLQQWASTADLPDGPLLVLIEDVTGAGKTEAAQMIVHRLMADGRVGGAYWAMPTQATANAMYERQARAIGALFTRGGDHRPSLALAHGQVRLHESFRASVLALGDGGATDRDGPIAGGAELPAGAACAAFFADDRRAALLADVGAGTVDQALLGVLPSKFNAVRLFGLADKVLVVDEAHAYDAYMGVEVDELLRFHAALGGYAVVLSATLPIARREQLARAWREGLDGGRLVGGGLFGCGGMPLARDERYPLATVVARGEPAVRETPLTAAPWSNRSVDVRFVHDASDALQHVVSAATAGAAVAWVRNTVDDCLAAAGDLRARGLEPLVFHARFAQCDRQLREQEVLRRFGPQASSAERSGRVVVATQVIEQSLDLDFDVMVSDLAPMDLIIQRAGRLWRHPARDDSRPRGLERELVVLAPAAEVDPETTWLSGLLPGTSAVYRNTGVLWRTVRALSRVRAIRTPGGVRALIEAVYGRDAEDVPEALLTATFKAEGKQRADAATANYTALKVGDGYDGNARGWIDEVRAPTRLSDPSTTVRLARVDGDGALVPWAPGEGPAWKRWALSEVRLSSRRVPPDVAAEPGYRAAVDAVRAEWGRYERELPVLPLVERARGEWQGTLEAGARTVHLRYTEGEGLAYQSAQAPDAPE